MSDNNIEEIFRKLKKGKGVATVSSDDYGYFFTSKIQGLKGGDLKLFINRIEYIKKGKKKTYWIQDLKRARRELSNLNITLKRGSWGSISFPMSSKMEVDVWVELVNRLMNHDYVFTPKDTSEKETKTYNSNYYSIEYADSLDGIPFEHYFAEILKLNNFRNIQVTTGSNDHAIDIIAWKGNRKCAIQCKRWKSKVGSDTIQKTFSGMKYWGASDGIIVTTSGFTRQAEQEAAEFKIILWGREKVEEMIENARELSRTANVQEWAKEDKQAGEFNHLCRFCGSRLTSGANFCSMCGKKI